MRNYLSTVDGQNIRHKNERGGVYLVAEMESTGLWAVLDTLHARHEPGEYCDFCELIRWMRGRSLAEVWEQCPRADWLILLCGKMAGQSGWPTREEIVLAVSALARASAGFQLRDELATKWELGEATNEQLAGAVSAYARTAAYDKISEYVGHGGDAEAFAIDAAATREEKVLREAADFLRQTLKAPYHPSLERTKPKGASAHDSLLQDHMAASAGVRSMTVVRGGQIYRIENGISQEITFVDETIEETKERHIREWKNTEAGTPVQKQHPYCREFVDETIEEMKERHIHERNNIRSLETSMEDYSDNFSNPNAVESRFEDMEGRINEITEGHDDESHSHSVGSVVYIFGSSLAMILSWSRNGSILYCIGHGILSWTYVIYFALTR